MPVKWAHYDFCRGTRCDARDDLRELGVLHAAALKPQTSVPVRSPGLLRQCSG
jgi:hypothetical protein